MHRATAQFENGLPTLLVGGDSNPEESWFIYAIQDLINNEVAIEPD